LPRFYRVIGRRLDGTPMDNLELEELVLTISQYYTNGVLVLEEMNSYIRDNVPPEFYSFITNLRHRGVDVYSHHQSIGDPRPDMYSQIKIIRLHFTMDSFTRTSVRNKVLNFELAMIGEIVVKKNHFLGVRMFNEALQKYGDEELIPKNEKIIIDYFKYFFVYIDFEENILGNITEEDFIEACSTYLFRFESKLINQMMNEEI
jgi:hypothetical protein